MPIVAKNDVPAVQTLREREVGHALQQVHYPNMIDCLSVTGYIGGASGLLGTHISPGEDDGELTETLRLLAMAGGRACTGWRGVGNFTRHVANTRVPRWKSRSRIIQALREAVGTSAQTKTCDTTSLYAGGGYGLGYTIVVSADQQGVEVGYRLSGNRHLNSPLTVLAENRFRRA